MRIISKHHPNKSQINIILKGALTGKEMEHLKLRLTSLLTEDMRKVILNCEEVSQMEPEGKCYLKQWCDELKRKNIEVLLIVKV